MDRPCSPCGESEPDARATAGLGGAGRAFGGGMSVHCSLRSDMHLPIQDYKEPNILMFSANAG